MIQDNPGEKIFWDIGIVAFSTEKVLFHKS